jgi:hypothetical protein
LEAYVTATLCAPVLDPDLLSTWLAFWSMVKSDPEVALAGRVLLHRVDDRVRRLPLLVSAAARGKLGCELLQNRLATC